MEKEMTFGRCLKTLLLISNIRMSQLAKAINVDSSLISRWVHEKRIPAVTYLKNIAKFLAMNYDSPLQMKIINEMITHLSIDISASESDEDIIYEILAQSLAYSNKNKYSGNSLSAASSHLKKSQYQWDEMSEICCSIKRNNAINLSERDKIIYGDEAIYNILISLLDQTSKKANYKNKQIYLTYQNNLNDSFFSCEILDYLKNKILECIHNGWNVTFLIRLDCSVGSIIKFIDFLLPLIKTGKVKLFYLNLYEGFALRKELYIVSNLGALSCFPLDSKLEIECAFFLQSPSAIEVFVDYINLLVANSSSDVIKYYEPHNSNIYYQSLTSINEKSGNQYSYNNSFSRLLIPESLYMKFIEQTDLTIEDKKLSLRCYNKQFRAFIKNIGNHIFKEIYFLSILDQLCERKTLYLYTNCGTKVINMENQDIIEYLEHVIYILRNFDNYHIAIVQNEMEEFIHNINLLIKERSIVFLDIFRAGHRESDIHLSINNPVVVKAFITYYNSLWEKISSLNKDKQDIIALIEDYIRVLKCERRL